MNLKLFLIPALVLFCTSAAAAEPIRYKYVEASDLTMVGKVFSKTSNPYQRVDSLMIKHVLKGAKGHAMQSSGIAVCFKTNSKAISVIPHFSKLSENGHMFSSRGFDLYAYEDGKWIWAGIGACKKESQNGQSITIKTGMDGSSRTFMLYLPLFSQLSGLEIGVEESAEIEAGESPLRHRIAFFGSSFTHGSCTTRAGMALPSVLSRMTGLQFCSLGCAGMSKLQPWFAECLKQADVDAYLFDAFSNPTTDMIRERLYPFIEQFQEARPGVPLIFIKSIYRSSSNLSTSKWQEKRFALVEEMMKVACEKYPDVYYVTTTSIENDFYDPTVDGTHPDNFGYYLWAKSIKDPVTEILAKYGIK